ncbi:diadenylate cyclase [Patescibacteria group bacterium AH-259-L07]|nr:diadenylate cyclase [Patescibacteria group bacterium AH-259-L07]
MKSASYIRSGLGKGMRMLGYKKEFHDIYFSKTGIAKKHKILVLEAIHRIVNRSRKPFGLLIVLGWREKWSKEYALVTDLQQDIFRYKPRLFLGRSMTWMMNTISKTKYFDGAILIRRKGYASASGVFLTNLRPSLLVEHLEHKMVHDLSKTLGFKEKVHSRHLIAITASWQLKQTTVYTVSEETKTIRIYEDGRIIYSIIGEEIWQPREEK